jgi:hypothetical protein
MEPPKQPEKQEDLWDCAHGAGIGDAAIVNNPAGAFGAGPSAIGKEICVYGTPEEPHNWKRVVGVVSSGTRQYEPQAAETTSMSVRVPSVLCTRSERGRLSVGILLYYCACRY